MISAAQLGDCLDGWREEGGRIRGLPNKALKNLQEQAFTKRQRYLELFRLQALRRGLLIKKLFRHYYF